MSLETVIATIEGDLKTGLADLEEGAEAGVLAVWNWGGAEFTKLLPVVEEDALDIADAGVKAALAGGSNEIGDIVQAMKEIAENSGSTVLDDLGEDALNILASLAKARAAAATTA